MKRFTVNGNERDPTGAHLLFPEQISEAGGVDLGEQIILLLEGEDLECDAVVQSYPGWEPHLFGRETSEWRPQSDQGK